MEKGSENSKEGLNNNGTVSDWPLDRRCSLKIASTDQQLSDFLLSIKSSKTPAVINYGASCVNRGGFMELLTVPAENQRQFLHVFLCIILMNAQKQLNTFDTPRPSNSSVMVKRWTRCVVLEKKGCMIAYGCTPRN